MDNAFAPNDQGREPGIECPEPCQAGLEPAALMQPEVHHLAPRYDHGVAVWPLVDRRTGTDRRNAPTPFWSAFLGLRRRSTGRRAGDNESTYVDRFSQRDVLLVIVILLLNIFDAFFTLLWLHRGGAEANPLMAMLLELGIGPFVVQKSFIVGGSLLVLVVHKNFRLARLGLRSLATVYSLLILYHFVLMAGGVDPRGFST